MSHIQIRTFGKHDPFSIDVFDAIPDAETLPAEVRAVQAAIAGEGLPPSPDLEAMLAFTEGGRVPPFAARRVCTATRDARNLLNPAHPASVRALAPRVHALGSFYMTWKSHPTDSDWPIGAPCPPDRDRFLGAYEQLVAALQTAGGWDVPRPPESAFRDSRANRMADTMGALEWIRWILIPRFEGALQGTTTLPDPFRLLQLMIASEYEGGIVHEPKWWPLLRAMGELEDCCWRDVGPEVHTAD